MIRFAWSSALVATFTGHIILGATAAVAQPATEFFKGKTVTLTVGFDAGGTYGQYSLGFAEHFSRHIPGNPTVVVSHMPGAGGTVATNYVFNVAAKDGTVLLMPPDTVVVSELLQPRGIRYKTAEFQWLGVIAQTNAVLVMRSDTGARTVKDIRAKQFVVGSTGRGSQTFLMPALMNAVMGAKLKIVTGYPGSAKTMLAMEQGEIQGISLTWGSWKLSRAEWFKNGFAVPIVQFGLYKEPDLPNVPMGQEFVTNDDDKKIVALLSSLSPVGRGFVAPPGVPADRVAVLRAAFDATVNDKRTIEDFGKRNFDINPLTGAEVQKVIAEISNVSPDLAKRASKAIFGDEGS
jgi:tripartite-type tricarboxylate transporter receptor subunit TctC